MHKIEGIDIVLLQDEDLNSFCQKWWYNVRAI